MIVERSAVDAIVAHAREEAPRECCGLLVGDQAVVREAVRSKNLAENPNRFLIDPRAHIAARRAARAGGRTVLGFYHSHPHSAPEPSARDLDEAAYPGYLYLIVGLAVEPPQIRVFRLEHGNFRPVTFVTGS